MLINFQMLNKNLNINFKALGKAVDGVLVFPDRSIKNTTIEVAVKENEVVLLRKGETKMEQVFKLHENTFGSYENSMGVSLKIGAYTKEMVLKDHEINITYDFYIENDLEDTNKLIIKY